MIHPSQLSLAIPPWLGIKPMIYSGQLSLAIPPWLGVKQLFTQVNSAWPSLRG